MLGWSRSGSRSPRCASSVRWCCCTSISIDAAGAAGAVSRGRGRTDSTTSANRPTSCKRWKRGVMSTVGDVPAHNVVLGQIRGEAVYIFDLEEVATVIALHRKVGTNVVVDLRLKGLKEPRENDIWLLGAIGPRMVYSTNLDAARRACDRRMVTFAHTAPDCAEIMWNEQNWTLVACRSPAPAPSGTRACAPCASSTTCCGCCRRCPQRPAGGGSAGGAAQRGTEPSAGAGRPRGVAAQARRAGRGRAAGLTPVGRCARSRSAATRVAPKGCRRPPPVRSQRPVRPATTSTDSACRVP